MNATIGDFTVYPAIDVRDGRVVRLEQGDYARETRYADDPLALARDYARAGARWLHLVDLDAAREGGYTLARLLASIKQETGLRVQTGGGVRGEADVEALLKGGADRVVVGSLAVKQPECAAQWLQTFGGDRLAIALDVRPDGETWRPATHGWTQRADADLRALVLDYASAGMRHLLATDIARDGMLAGPSLPLYAALRGWAPGVGVQCSGGTRDVDDVHWARASGCAGIVLGKALLEGRIQLREALAC